LVLKEAGGLPLTLLLHPRRWQFAALIESKIGTEEAGPDEKLWSKEKRLADVDFSAVDWIYTPIIQSGGVYDLKPSAESDGRNLKAGVIIANVGLRVRSYCANIGRTFLIDPAKQQEKNYAFLVEVQKFMISLLKAGAVVKEVVGQVNDYVRDKKPELADFLVKSFGARVRGRPHRPRI
jgi:nucleosome binding factor SPN SPT16 subunit